MNFSTTEELWFTLTLECLSLNAKRRILAKIAEFYHLLFPKDLLPAWDEHNGTHSNAPFRREFMRK